MITIPYEVVALIGVIAGVIGYYVGGHDKKD